MIFEYRVTSPQGFMFDAPLHPQCAEKWVKERDGLETVQKELLESMDCKYVECVEVYDRGDELFALHPRCAWDYERTGNGFVLNRTGAAVPDMVCEYGRCKRG